MRKLLAILLISLLSLQASWAAAASYCRHERGAAARHFGHHEHQHDLQAAGKAGKQEAGTQEAGKQEGTGAVPLAAHAANVYADAAGDAGASLAGPDLDCSVCHAHALVGVPTAAAPTAVDAPAVAGGPLAQHPLPSVPQTRPERPNWLAA